MISIDNLHKKLEKYIKIVDTTPKNSIKKYIFSTNIFIPQECNINNKTFSYFTNLVKWVETFENHIKNYLIKIKDDVGLIIYYDSQFDNKKYNDSNYVLKEGDTEDEKVIKENYAKNKNELNKILNCYYTYINWLINNIEKYPFIKLYKFDAKHYLKSDKKYLGHPKTFGSFIRFIPAFTDIDTVSLVNVSQPLNIKQSQLFLDLINDENIKIISTFDPNYNFDYDGDKYHYWMSLMNPDYDFENIHNTYYDIKIQSKNLTRLAAGCFYSKNTNPYHNEKVLMESIIRCIDEYNSGKILKQIKKKNKLDIKKSDVFVYGIDEIILSYCFPINVTKPDNFFKPIYCHGLAGFIRNDRIGMNSYYGLRKEIYNFINDYNDKNKLGLEIKMIKANKLDVMCMKLELTKINDLKNMVDKLLSLIELYLKKKNIKYPDSQKRRILMRQLCLYLMLIDSDDFKELKLMKQIKCAIVDENGLVKKKYKKLMETNNLMSSLLSFQWIYFSPNIFNKIKNDYYKLFSIRRIKEGSFIQLPRPILTIRNCYTHDEPFQFLNFMLNNRYNYSLISLQMSIIEEKPLFLISKKNMEYFNSKKQEIIDFQTYKEFDINLFLPIKENYQIHFIEDIKNTLEFIKEIKQYYNGLDMKNVENKVKNFKNNYLDYKANSMMISKFENKKQKSKYKNKDVFKLMKNQKPLNSKKNSKKKRKKINKFNKSKQKKINTK